jgi:hypothetical protein
MSDMKKITGDNSIVAVDFSAGKYDAFIYVDGFGHSKPGSQVAEVAPKWVSIPYKRVTNVHCVYLPFSYSSFQSPISGSQTGQFLAFYMVLIPVSIPYKRVTNFPFPLFRLFRPGVSIPYKRVTNPLAEVMETQIFLFQSPISGSQTCTARLPFASFQRFNPL